jgi:hypothetical protein
VVMDSAVYGSAKSRTPRPMALESTLTLHCCDEVFADGARNRAPRVSRFGPDVRTPHVSHVARQTTGAIASGPSPAPRRPPGPRLLLLVARAPRASSPLAFTGRRSARLALPAPARARWGSVMRYRSATVAGFHGLPCFPNDCQKERPAAAPHRPACGEASGIFVTRINKSRCVDMSLAKPPGDPTVGPA